MFFFLFGLTQLIQLGMGILITNYGAGSIAHKLSRTSTVNPDATMIQAYNDLMVVGMQALPPYACQDASGTDTTAGVTSNVVVIAEARITTFPVIGPMLNAMHVRPLEQDGAWKMTGACTPGAVPAVGFVRDNHGYAFIVRGSAVARRNYL